MKQAFRKVRLSKSNIERLAMINSIIEDYQEQGYTLTLRQLYYQLVSRDVIPNKLAEYAKLSTLLKEGRMGGIVDWEAIEDRLRVPSIPYSADDIEDALDDITAQYRLNRMEDQDTYIEVWVEKDALSGVLKRITEKYHINIMVNRGYSSASAMYDAYNRFRRAKNRGQNIALLYLGDFDPSGVDMIRDINARINEFFGYTAEDIKNGEGADFFTIQPIALTKEQIRKYNPPPNPAKKTDPRAGGFIKANGATSWEVDALKPEVLNKILEDAILEHIDEEKYEAVIAREEEDKEKISNFRDSLAQDNE